MKLRGKGRATAGRDGLPIAWMNWSDRALCSRGCGGQCCKASAVPLTEEEARRLPSLARSLALPQPSIVPAATVGASGAFIMQARPCTFLGKSNLCQIYRDRPAHCRDFPSGLRASCPLSVRKFGAE